MYCHATCIFDKQWKSKDVLDGNVGESGMSLKGRRFAFGTQARISILYTRDMAGWAVTKMGGGTS